MALDRRKRNETRVDCMIDDFSRKSGSLINVHAMMPRSCVNGPGMRTAIWFQGCTLDCAGCFNPQIQAHTDSSLILTEKIVAQITNMKKELEGVTLTGGEPLQQVQSVVKLLSGIRRTTNLSILLFSGYTMNEILQFPSRRNVLDLIDVLITGRYIPDLHMRRGMRGSSNQKIHLLTDRYCLRDIECVPPAEIRIDRNGNIQLTGIAPPRISAVTT